jgi:hypothetical protein
MVYMGERWLLFSRGAKTHAVSIMYNFAKYVF